MRDMKRLPALLLTILTLQSAAAIHAQTRQSTPDDAFFKKLASLDAQVFEAYNTCDLDKFASFFAEDVEFYHDKGGLMRGRQALVDAVKNNICGKTRRDLVPGTLEVHPMDNFGALQLGTARFCDAKQKQCDGKSGVGKFIHLWQNSGDTWKITRVFSYDHASAGK
jgi:ketosteroid isomerase-like protein